MKKIYLTCLGLFCSALTTYAQRTFPQNGAHDERPGRYAFTNATIIADGQTKLSNATMLIENGVIKEVGTQVNIPKGTVVTDLKGKYIYPSFIDLYSDYGMPAIGQATRGAGRPAPQLESNKKGVYGWNQAINAEQRAVALFDVQADKAAELRKVGFGTVLSHYRDGIVRGTGTLVALSNQPSNKAVLKTDASAHFSFSKGTSTQNYPNSGMGAVALLRQTYYDAEWHEKGGSKEERNLSLEAFNQIKKLPSIFEADNKWSILRSDAIGDEFGVQYIMKGGGDEYQRTDEIKKTNAAVIVPLTFPDAYDLSDAWDSEVVTVAELKHWEMAPSNAAALANANIPFTFTAAGLKTSGEFLARIKKAIAYGLTPEKALEALTVAPAKLIQADDQLGVLKKGYLANFLITSGDIFREDAVIHQNWVQGNVYTVTEQTSPDLRGTYELTIAQQPVGKLNVTGTALKHEYQLVLNDSSKVSPKVSIVNDLFSMNYTTDKSKSQTVRLTGYYTNNTLSGSGVTPEGTSVTWKASLKEPFQAKAVAAKKDSTLQIGEVVYPFVGLGTSQRVTGQTLLIKNATVWTNEKDGILKNTDVLVQNGKIARVGKSLSAPSGAKVIDGTGKHLTSGIIDEHSHIALYSVNEGSQSSTAEVRMADVINPDDVNIYRQLSGGVTTSQLLHGSANAIGGQSAVIKLKWGGSVQDLLLPDAKYIKFALGENVKQSNWGDVVRVRYPQTRMGVEQIYFDHFIRAREYDAAWKQYKNTKNKANVTPPRRDLELDALAEILNNERFITCHSYVQSEINMLMKVADSLNFKVNTFTHILEGYKVADKMAKRQIAGSTFADWWAYKMEVTEAIPYNAALMAREGVLVSINSDDAEMARRLNQEAAKVVNFGGVSEEDAWKMVTLNPAKIMQLDHKIGSIKTGKDGDLVLWNDNPLSIYASPEYTIIEGGIYFSREEDAKRRQLMNAEKARLVQKSISAKASGAPTQSPQSVRAPMWHCEDILGDHDHNHDHE